MEKTLVSFKDEIKISPRSRKRKEETKFPEFQEYCKNIKGKKSNNN